MGTGALRGSIDSNSAQDDIVNALLPHYMSDTNKWDNIYRILVERANSHHMQRQSGLVSTDPVTDLTEVIPCTQEIVEILNLARGNPKSFIPILEKHLATFTDDTHYADKNGRENLRIRTREGKAAVEKCIEFLRRAEPVRPVAANIQLELAAIDHAKDLCAHTDLMHNGSDGSSLQQRVERQGEWRGLLGENIDCGNRSALNAVMMMLIDDGVASRAHRANCLNPNFLVVGAAVGPHPLYGHCIVLDLATQVLSWTEVQTTDIVVVLDPTKTEESASEEFHRVVRSIPVENVVKTIEEAMGKRDTVVTIDFKAEACTALVSLKKGKTVRKLNVKWGT